uniref:Uncharacterized protein n=1 Tax=viral metagenome TaxID=1070528 RepID=A0A6C0CIZ1_9ZZZZ
METWFTRHVFFLQGQHSLEDIEPFGVFDVECEDNQVIYGPHSTLYNIETRHWRIGKNIIYDVEKLVFHREERYILVFFVVIDIMTTKRLCRFDQKYQLDDSYVVNPSCGDYQPRLEAIERLARFGLTESDVEKFFRLFYLASLNHLYTNHPEVAEGKKPVHQGLLKRLQAAFEQLPNKYPLFGSHYSFKNGPLCLVDQRLDKEGKEPDRVGNILVRISLHSCEPDEEFRW